MLSEGHSLRREKRLIRRRKRGWRPPRDVRVPRYMTRAGYIEELQWVHATRLPSQRRHCKGAIARTRSMQPLAPTHPLSVHGLGHGAGETQADAGVGTVIVQLTFDKEDGGERSRCGCSSPGTA